MQRRIVLLFVFISILTATGRTLAVTDYQIKQIEAQLNHPDAPANSRESRP